MGRIVSNFFMSLDGVVESPDEWHFPYFDDAMGAVIERGMERSSAFLMGRVLYQEWAAYWPEQAEGEDAGFASFINGVHKYVVSNTLTEATWTNTTLISGDRAKVADELRAAKERTDGDISISGSATLVRSLLADGVLDELALLVHPVAVGHGQRLFEDTPAQSFELLEQQALPTGVLYLRYGPAG